MVRWERAVMVDKAGKVCVAIRCLTENPIQTAISNERMHCLIKQSNSIGLVSGIMV